MNYEKLTTILELICIKYTYSSLNVIYTQEKQEKMATNKIVIYGGSGLVGSSYKDIVTNSTDIYYFPTRQEVNLMNFEDVKEYMSKIQPNVVINLAGYVGGLFGNMSEPVNFFNVNMQINMNVINAVHSVCEKNTILISLLSTCIFPDKMIEYPITSDMLHNGPPHESNEGYAYAKRMIDVLTRCYRKQYNARYITITPSNLYGEYDHFDDIQNSHVVPALINKAYNALINSEKIEVKGTGNPLRQFTYVNDLINSIEYIWRNFEQFDRNDTIIVTNTEEVSIKQLIHTIAETFGIGENRIIFDNIPSNDGQYKKTSKCDEILEQSIKFTSLRQGILNVIQKYLKMKSL